MLASALAEIHRPVVFQHISCVFHIDL